MNITLVVSDLSASGAGRWGDAVRPFLLTKALQSLGHRIKIIGFNNGESVVQSSPELPIAEIVSGIYPQFFQSARQMLRSLEADPDCDLIYAYKLKPSSFGLALLQRYRQSGAKTPVFLDIDDWELSWHGGDSFRYRPTPRQLYRDVFKSESALRNPDDPFYLQQMERFVSQANHVTTHNAFLQGRFGGTYVPNGKDICLFNPENYDPEASRDRFNLTPYRTLMFPGAPRPYKGVEDILTALDILDEPDLRLVIVGGSPYDQYDQQLTQQWGHRLIKLPRTPYSQMPEIISAAHAIVVPQRDNPATKAQFPLKLTDGMAMAKPILATRVGDVPEILGDAGYLVDSNSPQQLADGIRTLFSEFDTAQQKGQQARQRCIEHYSIEAMAKTLESILPARPLA
ncbi:MAG: glycosyltransferase family 4 protein [Synechococcales cyanobacterium RU_4_20]|nr:glycosyltransferase family 4 protein [Synechococcales cyanobacterium RU_4_20]